MELAQHLAHDARALSVAARGPETKLGSRDEFQGFDKDTWKRGASKYLMHSEQNPAVYWLETVAHIRKRPPHNDAHAVAHEAIAKLTFNF